MVRNLKRLDPHKVDGIRSVFQTCKEASFSDDETAFYALHVIPDATLPEWTKARYYREIGADNQPDTDFKNLYRRWERWFNSDDRNPDEKIIGVPQGVKTKNGKLAQIWYRRLAVGEAAERSAKFCDIPMRGWKNRQTGLNTIARDIGLQARHDAKYKALQNRIRRSKRRRKSSQDEGQSGEDTEGSSS